VAEEVEEEEEIMDDPDFQALSNTDDKMLRRGAFDVEFSN
jgi:hypothetical protein